MSYVMRRIRGIILVGACLLSICNPVRSSEIAGKIESIIADLNREPNEMVRFGNAGRLATFIGSQAKESLETLDENSIDTIASLLSDNNVAVRASAAIALGDIGPSAMRAVPALENGLKRVDEGVTIPIFGTIGPSATVETEIRRALDKIRGKRQDSTQDK